MGGQRREKGESIISSSGIGPWSDPAVKIRTYFRVDRAGVLRLGLRARGAEGQSTLSCTFNGKSREIKLLSPAGTPYPLEHSRRPNRGIIGWKSRGAAVGRAFCRDRRDPPWWGSCFRGDLCQG
ncbi:MAG: DUF5077 domain-containing protein [Haliscomenobacter sp.]|nr:DUF5077 domain-containing protein [Haliscomenobacter sp.]